VGFAFANQNLIHAVARTHRHRLHMNRPTGLGLDPGGVEILGHRFDPFLLFRAVREQQAHRVLRNRVRRWRLLGGALAGGSGRPFAGDASEQNDRDDGPREDCQEFAIGIGGGG